jgi:hypothetical protein
MRTKSGAYLFLVAGISAMMSACGGGGGGGGSAAATPITVTAAKNPVLVGGSTTITASFVNYTSAVKFGSTVNFGVSAPGTLGSATAKTQAGGIATVTVNSAQAATVTVSASSGNFAGATTVSFIPLPATASVSVTPQTAINSLGGIQFDLASDLPVTFSNYTTAPLTGTALPIVNPVIGSNNVTLMTAGLVSVAGVNVSAGNPIFKLSFTVPSSALAVPIFSIDQTSVVAAFANLSTVRPKPVLNVKSTYFDAAGKILFP